MTTSRPAAAGIAEYAVALLLVIALVLMQVLIGGTRPVFSLPSFAIVAMAGLVGAGALLRRGAPIDPFCAITIAAFASYLLARAALSPVGYIARADAFTVLGCVVVYGVTAFVLRNARARAALLFALLIVAAGHVVVGAMQFARGDNFMPLQFLQRYDYGNRASGFYICPNHLAGLLELIGVCGLALVCWSRLAMWLKLLAGYLTLVCYAGLLLTGSRGGYLSAVGSLVVVVGLSFVALRNAPRRASWLALGAAALLFVGAAAVTFAISRSDLLTARAANVFDVRNGRLSLWHAAIDQWRLSPIFGTGSGTYLFYGRMFRAESMQRDPVYVHNDYLQLLSEYGAAGLLLCGLCLAAHVRRGWKSFRHFGPKRIATAGPLASNQLALNIAAFATVAAYAVHSVVDFNLHIPANALLFTMLFAFLGTRFTRGESAIPPRRVRLAGAMALLTGALVLGCAAIRLLPPEYFAEQARIALRDGQPVAALQFARQGIRLDKKNPTLLYHAGRAFAAEAEQLGDPRVRASFYRSAAAAFATARKLMPVDAPLAIELAFTYDALGRYAEAEWMFYEAFRLDPRSEPQRQYYATHLAEWSSTRVPYADFAYGMEADIAAD